MKKVSFRIRRQYFDKIVIGEKTEELRSYTEFWIKRLLKHPQPKIAVFVCGKDVHRRWITNIYIEKPEEILGRPLSLQGQQDIVTENCIVIGLGKIYE